MTTETKQRPEQEKEDALAWVDEVEVETALADVSDERCCVVHKGFRKIDAETGLMLLPPDRITYLDRQVFVGGIAHDVPISVAKEWVRKGIVSKSLVFKNNTDITTIESKTGRYLASQGVAGVAGDLSTERILALLGPEKAAALARELHRAASSREEESK